jgi:hypothetical protein
MCPAPEKEGEGVKETGRGQIRVLKARMRSFAFNARIG